MPKKDVFLRLPFFPCPMIEISSLKSYNTEYLLARPLPNALIFFVKVYSSSRFGPKSVALFYVVPPANIGAKEVA